LSRLFGLQKLVVPKKESESGPVSMIHHQIPPTFRQDSGEHSKGPEQKRDSRSRRGTERDKKKAIRLSFNGEEHRKQSKKANADDDR
jgi:hypothetical protein